MKNKILILLLCVHHLALAFTDSTKVVNKLILEFPLLDMPFVQTAAKMAYNKRMESDLGKKANPEFTDYLRGYESLSMTQALAVTKNMHATNYYFNNKLWNNIIKPDTKKKVLLNRLAANITAGTIDYALAYYLMVFGPVWLHEEFHRNGITHQCISSHNDTYKRLTGGISSGSVSKVKDEDLIKYKHDNPQNLIRSFAAGIEAQYSLIRNLNKENFYTNTRYANIAMNVLLTNQAVNYVNQFKATDYDATIDRAQRHEANSIDIRDYVGWDFTAWVYDLFKPYEAYAARGSHPYGPGIHRDIKRSQLTDEEDKYLSLMGNLSYLNYLSPTMLGINRIKLNDFTYFNFGIRHTLNSFGYDLGADIYWQRKNQQWFIGLHGYKNKEKLFPGIEIERPDLKLNIGKLQLPISLTAMTWLQPKNQLFYDIKGKPGGLLKMKFNYGIKKSFSFYSEVEAKTAGWVMANPYLEDNFTFRTGIRWDIKK